MIVYPSPNDVRVYINGLWLQSVYRIEFQTQKNVTPIVNYRSSEVETFATGPGVVSGSLVLNFLHPSYLPLLFTRFISAQPRDTQEELLESARMFLASGTEEDLTSAATLLMSMDASKLQVQTGLDPRLMPALDYDAPFDIILQYATSKWYRLIKDCRLSGEAEVLSASPAPGGDASSSGSPILEQYTFVARKIEVRESKSKTVESTSRDQNGL